MKSELLTDIDSLVLQVHNSNSKRYILESIDAFRIGSYRASILSAWVALTYDLIQKIRDLAIAEEKFAQEFITAFDNYVELDNLEKLAKVEREILETVKSFEIISTREYYELCKLQKDRHLCAHPAFSSEDDLFEPSAEQVRFNIVNVLNFVLIQKPIQGKKAVQNLNDFINGSTFPTMYEDAKKVIRTRFIVRAKKSFVSNAIKLLLKNLIKQTWGAGNAELQERYVFSLKVFYELETISTVQIIKHHITQYLGDQDQAYLNLLSVLSIDSAIWNLISSHEQITLEGVIKKTTNFNNTYFLECLNIAALNTIVMEKIKGMDDSSFLSLVDKSPLKLFKDSMIERLTNDPNFSKTRDYGQRLAGSYSKYISALDLKRILDFAKSNIQFYGYFYSDQILKDLYRNTKDRLLGETTSDWKHAASSGKLNELNAFLIQEGLINESS